MLQVSTRCSKAYSFSSWCNIGLLFPLSGILGIVMTFIILDLIFWDSYRPVSLPG
jgi:hypothetical protein